MKININNNNNNNNLNSQINENAKSKSFLIINAKARKVPSKDSNEPMKCDLDNQVAISLS